MTIIGERINVGFAGVAQALRARDAAAIAALVEHQVAAGCDYVELHAGLGGADASRVADGLCWMIDVALDAGPIGLCLDCPDPAVMRVAAAHLDRRRPWLLNSLTAEPARLEAMLALALEYDGSVIGLAIGAEGMAVTAAARLRACETIFRRVTDAGLPPDRLFLDAIAIPVGRNPMAGLVTLDVVASLARQFPEAHRLLGLSNISYRIPERRTLNRTFAVMAVARGVDAFILDAGDRELLRLVRQGD